MKKLKNFPFEKSRRITSKEVASARKAIEAKTGQKRKSRGRPCSKKNNKYVPTSIRLHPIIVVWAKKEAKKKGVGYQTVINESLLKKAAAKYKTIEK